MKVRYVLLYRRISGGYISQREKEKEEENEKEKERETERECRIVAAYGSVTELKAWVLAGVRTRTCAALSAPRVFVCEIAPYTLSRWKVRYIVNPVLSTLSRRRSLYQVRQGVYAPPFYYFSRSFLLSLFLLLSFALTILFLLFSSFHIFASTALLYFNFILSLSLSRARARERRPFLVFSFPYSCSLRSPRYNPGTLAWYNRPFSIPHPHYTIDLYYASYLYLHGRVYFNFVSCYIVLY